MSSILSTRACGVGTQTTSLPSWPTVGSKGFVEVCACANAPAQVVKSSDAIAAPRT
jgi:hypothetical protein